MRFLRVALAAMLMLAVIGTASTAQASTSCPHVSWGSLPKASTTISSDTHIRGVRAGQHPCFDRIVIDLDGQVTGYAIDYVSGLSHEGSGKAVPVSGGAIIRIITRAPAYDDNGEPTISPASVDGISVGGYRTFRDVAWAGSFEGQTTLGLGVRARLPFRVFALDGPGNGSRLVIDVAHRW